MAEVVPAWYKWKVIVTYFLLATGISLLFRVYEPRALDFLKLPYGFGLNLLVGFGPLVAAFLSRRIFKGGSERLTLFGSSVLRSLAFVLAPVMVFVIAGVKNKVGLNVHLFGLHTGFLWLIYIYGEECGWRGYLQQLVKGNMFLRALIIGSVWYVWHLSFVFDGYDFLKELVFLAVLITGSYIALWVTTRTNSLLTAVGLHFSFSVMTNIPFTTGYKYGVVVMIVFWGILLFAWKKRPV
jgi:membrane protease YdiL (CAAX protease family)